MKPGRPPHDWAPWEDELLGTMRDTVLAKQLGVCTHTVTTRRNRLGIPKYLAPSDAYIGATYIDTLRGRNIGKTALARELGLTRAAIHVAIRRYRAAVERAI